MEISYNVTGAKRKELVNVISKATGMKAVYKFMPTCNFEIGSFTVNKPGVYAVAFHGRFTPVTGSSFPLTNSVYLSQNGSSVPGAVSNYIFQTSNGMANQTFSIPVAVQTAPTTLQVISQGGTILYDGVTLSIYRLGDIPTS